MINIKVILCNLLTFHDINKYHFQRSTHCKDISQSSVEMLEMGEKLKILFCINY